MEQPDDAWTRLWSAVNRHPARVLAALVVLFLGITVYQAATRLLWVDEILTLSIAQQGSAPGIWRALALGADPNPPLIHLAVLLSTRLFGHAALAVRLPSILGMLLAIVALWTILRRWLLPGFAALGVLALMTTRGFDYAYEARSYAPLTGFTMLAFA
ncbi:MAG: glycosyltransferase family 39 protein, partial [Acidobacteriota bacterium]|nr:glycosyltransferase family 39 protein [Acidobacteriota bacterium]